MLILLLLAVAACFLFYKVYQHWWNLDPRKEFLRRQKHLRNNINQSLGNTVLTEPKEEQTSSFTTSYVIEEDGTILRRDDNEVESSPMAKSNIKVPETPVENNSNFIIASIQTQEEAAQEELILRKRMLAGEHIDFSQCNNLLDTVNDVELWKVIAKNHLSQPNKPLIDLINNYSSERAVEFMEMIYRIVSSCVVTNSDWCQLPPEFLKSIIVFSKNVDALYCIADMQESDLVNSEYDENLFNDIKLCAYNRYNYLTTKRK